MTPDQLPQAQPSESKAKALHSACAYLPVIGLALGSVVFTTLMQVAPHDSRLVTAVFSPFWTPEQAFVAAAQAGAVVGIGARPFMITIAGVDGQLVNRLRAAGALAVIGINRPPMCGITSRKNDGQ